MHDIDEEDEEETLSFCEFSINSDADTWEDSSRESQNTSFKSSERDDYFEFFSGELSSGKASFSYTPPENIIFCGKLILSNSPSPKTPKESKRSSIKSTREEIWVGEGGRGRDFAFVTD